MLDIGIQLLLRRKHGVKIPEFLANLMKTVFFTRPVNLRRKAQQKYW